MKGGWSLASKEAHQLHPADPNGTPEANLAVPTAEPDWDPNNGDIPHLEHYRKCVLVGPQKGYLGKRA